MAPARVDGSVHASGATTRSSAACSAGPTRDRLTTIAAQVHHGVVELFGIAKRGDELDDAIGRIDSASLRRRLDVATDDDSRVPCSRNSTPPAGCGPRATRPISSCGR